MTDKTRLSINDTVFEETLKNDNYDIVYSNKEMMNSELKQRRLDEKPTRYSQLTASSILYNKLKTSVQVSSKKSENEKNEKRQKVNTYIKNRFNHFQASVYNILERPSGYWSLLYRCFSFTIILASILFSAFTTLTTLSSWSKKLMFWVEAFCIIYFFLEYCVRVWSSGYRVPYQGLKGKIKFMLRPILAIELVAFILGVFLLTFGSYNYNGQIYLTPTILTLVRFVQLIRILYIDRKAQPWIVLINVVLKHKFELITSIYIGFIILLMSSYLILIFEKPYSIINKDDYFHSYADALYWSIITMTTIGYGDRTPRTFNGKIISTGLCILGVAFWTLPGGIIGSGLALKVEQKNKKKHFNRLVPAAARLIQSWWRMKAIHSHISNKSSCLVATLKVFEPNASKDRVQHNRTQSDSKVPRELNSVTKDTITESSYEERYSYENESNNLLNENDNEYIKYEKTREFILHQLSPEHLILIRTIVLMKYFAAKRKFKSAHKPYDFKDVIEQYTQGNMDILIKIKELQRKIDQTINNQRSSVIVQNGRSVSLRASRIPQTANGNDPLEQRLMQFENQMKSMEEKIETLLRHFETK